MHSQLKLVGPARTADLVDFCGPRSNGTNNARLKKSWCLLCLKSHRFARIKAHFPRNIDPHIFRNFITFSHDDVCSLNGELKYERPSWLIRTRPHLSVKRAFETKGLFCLDPNELSFTKGFWTQNAIENMIVGSKRNFAWNGPGIIFDPCLDRLCARCRR